MPIGSGTLNINSSTGTISGTIGAAAGNYTVTVTASDGANSTVDVFTWTVYPASDIVVGVPSTPSSTEGTSTSLNMGTGTGGHTTYTGSGTLAYAATGLPPGLVLNASTGVISGAPSAGDSFYSPYSVQVTATDGTAYDQSQTFSWDVSSPITVGSVSDQTTTEGTTISSITVTASGGSGYVFSAFGLPAGLHINGASGEITGTVAAGDFANSPYAVTLVAASGNYTGSENFNWTINSPITISIGDQSSAENTAISTVTATTTYTGGTVTWSAVGLPPGLEINATSGAITGTPSLGSAQLGPYAVTVIAEDGTYSGTANINWTVTCPISITQITDQNNSEGNSVSVSITASDSVSGASTRYGAVGLPAGLIINPTTGVISGTIEAGDAANGPYTVTVDVGDGTYNNAMSFNWNVSDALTFTNPPVDPTYNVGDTVSASAAVKDSISGTTPSYTGTSLPTGLTLNSSSGAISGTVTRSGYWQTEVTVTAGSYSNSTEIDWTVNGPISITDQGDLTNAIGDVLSTTASPSTAVTISATDTTGGSPTFTATGLPPGLTMSSSGVITGTIGSSASTTTPYTTTVTATAGSDVGVDVFTWVVNPAGTIVITNPGSVSNTSGDDVEMQVSATDSSNGTLMYQAINLPGGLYINPYNGYINGTIAASDVSASPYSVTIIANNGSSTGTMTFPWTIGAAAGGISSSNPGGQTSNEGATISGVSIGASGGTLYYTAFGLPPGLKISTSTGVISGTIAIGAGYESPYSVTVEASTGTAYVTQTFAWNVFSPISIGQLADQTNVENDSVSVAISETDSHTGGSMSYSALGLPPGLAINPTTGVISGSVAINAGNFSPYAVTIIAQDGTYSSQMTYNWNINSPVQFADVPDQTNNDSDSASLAVAATDSVGGSSVVYSGVGLPGGLSISSTGAITGTVAVGDSGIGYFSPTIIGNDGTYYNTTSINWTVNSPVQFSDPGDQTNVVGDTVSLLVNATDSSGATSEIYSVFGLPAGLSINTSTGLISGTVTGSSTIGTYQTTVFATDSSGYSNSDTFDWTITGAGVVTLSNPGDQTGAVEGTAITAPSLTCTDTTSGATVHFFAEGLPPGIVLSPSVGLSGEPVLSGTPAIGDAAYSPYYVTIIATDGSSFAQQSFTWTVTDPVTFTSATADQTNNEGDSPSLNFTIADTNSSGSVVFTAIGLPPGLSIVKTPTSGIGTISGTIAAGDAAFGSYTVTITANDGTYSGSETFTWTIGSAISFTAPASPSSVEGGSGAEASPTTSDTGLTWTAIGLPQGLSVNPATGAIVGTVAVGDAGTGTFNYTLIASNGTSSFAHSETWTVGSPITILGVSEQSFNASQAVSMQVQVSYTGTGTLSYSATGLPAGLTIDSVTGVISGTVDTGAAYRGEIVWSVVINDGTYYATSSLSLTILGDPDEAFKAVDGFKGPPVLAAGKLTAHRGIRPPELTSAVIPAVTSNGQEFGNINLYIGEGPVIRADYDYSNVLDAADKLGIVYFNWYQLVQFQSTVENPPEWKANGGKMVVLNKKPFQVIIDPPPGGTTETTQNKVDTEWHDNYPWYWDVEQPPEALKAGYKQDFQQEKHFTRDNKNMSYSALFQDIPSTPYKSTRVFYTWLVGLNAKFQPAAWFSGFAWQATSPGDMKGPTFTILAPLAPLAPLNGGSLKEWYTDKLVSNGFKDPGKP